MPIIGLTTFRGGGALSSVSNVFQDIPGLEENMPDGSTMLFEIYVPALAQGGTSGAAFTITGPGGFNLYSVGGVILNQPAQLLETVVQDNTLTGVFTTNLGFGPGYALFHVKGIIINSFPGGGGPLRVRAAQSNTDAGNALDIAANESWMTVQYIG